ncbi:MAG TPA: hypothetical protein VKB75_16680, partial [Jatrophihabitans sp.]|nr:hypothetical protein [Jatrophihabitans sp.]
VVLVVVAVVVGGVVVAVVVGGVVVAVVAGVVVPVVGGVAVAAGVVAVVSEVFDAGPCVAALLAGLRRVGMVTVWPVRVAPGRSADAVRGSPKAPIGARSCAVDVLNGFKACGVPTIRRNGALAAPASPAWALGTADVATNTALPVARGRAATSPRSATAVAVPAVGVGTEPPPERCCTAVRKRLLGGAARQGAGEPGTIASPVDEPLAGCGAPGAGTANGASCDPEVALVSEPHRVAAANDVAPDVDGVAGGEDPRTCDVDPVGV